MESEMRKRWVRMWLERGTVTRWQGQWIKKRLISTVYQYFNVNLIMTSLLRSWTTFKITWSCHFILASLCQPLFQLQHALNSRCTEFLLVIYHWRDLYVKLQALVTMSFIWSLLWLASSKQSHIPTMLCFHRQGLYSLPETGRGGWWQLWHRKDGGGRCTHTQRLTYI